MRAFQHSPQRIAYEILDAEIRVMEERPEDAPRTLEYPGLVKFMTLHHYVYAGPVTSKEGDSK